MYLINSDIKQLNMVNTQKKPCMKACMHWLDPLLNKCARRDFLINVK